MSSPDIWDRRLKLHRNTWEDKSGDRWCRPQWFPPGFQCSRLRCLHLKMQWQIWYSFRGLGWVSLPSWDFEFLPRGGSKTQNSHFNKKTHGYKHYSHNLPHRLFHLCTLGQRCPPISTVSFSLRSQTSKLRPRCLFSLSDPRPSRLHRGLCQRWQRCLEKRHLPKSPVYGNLYAVLSYSYGSFHFQCMVANTYVIKVTNFYSKFSNRSICGVFRGIVAFTE